MKRPITKQYEHTEILIIHSRPRWTCPLPRHRNHYFLPPPPPNLINYTSQREEFRAPSFRIHWYPVEAVEKTGYHFP